MRPLRLRSESRRRAACRLNAAQAPDFMYSCQARTEHFQQCAEFPLLCNRGLRPLAVTVGGAATGCAAVQSAAFLLSSLVTGRVSRSWSAPRTAGLSEIAQVVGSLVRLHCRGAKLTARQQRTTLTEASPPFSDGTL